MMEAQHLVGTYSSTDATAISRPIHLRSLLLILVGVPFAYFAISYIYLAWWHNKIFLWHTLVHENGRLTLAGSMFYFDHFVACVPMILLFSLYTAGGFALARHPYVAIDRTRASVAVGCLLGFSTIFVGAAVAASIYTVGQQRTADYVFQRIERDGVMSKGGNWNQLQLSNVPIALSAMSLGGVFVMSTSGRGARQDKRLRVHGAACVGVASALMIGIGIIAFPGWQNLLNPRWMAHSIRELATYPLTGIPIALSSILLVESLASGVKRWTISVTLLSVALITAGLFIVTAQLVWLANVDVLAIAQKPSFAPGGLSIFYLLTSHVFEHFLDFVLIGPLTGGIYGVMRFLSTRSKLQMGPL